MERIALTDGSGKWFNAESADQFDEASGWDGSNNISKATRSQTEHEQLYRTTSGKWILNFWSQWQGITQTYREIDDEQAAKWLITNGHESEVVKNQIAELEL